METIRVLFLPASGEGVGGGHVLRCLALAAALIERGAVCGFAVEPHGARLVQRFGEGLGVETVARTGDLARLVQDRGPDVVVVDDYGSTAATQGGLVAPSRLLAAIDDLADRRHLASLLIDPGYGRTAADYAGLLPARATVLAGPAYALLRPAFADAAPVTIAPLVKRVFLGFGLADPAGITLRALAALLPALPAAAFDVAAGRSAASLPGLQALATAHRRVSLHVEAERAATIMGRADLAVGAGGASTWERLRLGLPSVCVVVADNQRALSHSLAAEGLQVALEADAATFQADLIRVTTALAADATMRRRFSQEGRRLTDGQGARRAADAILKEASRLQGASPAK